MYSEERIIINSISFTVEEVYEQYKRGKLIFCENSNISDVRKNSIIKGVLEALSRGIPFIPIYVSELQTGQLLVLNKSDRLKYLMEFLECGFDNKNELGDINRKYEQYHYRRELYYSKILFYVIDYMNPRYVHMQVGSYLEEWTMTQEQFVRNVLYKELEDSIFKNILYEMRVGRIAERTIEYMFLYFIMVNLTMCGAFDKDEISIYGNADRFVLMERTIYRLGQINREYLSELSKHFMECFYDVNHRRSVALNGRLLSENRVNYICFLDVWRQIIGYDEDRLFYDKNIKRMIQNCDMSYEGIKQVIECFK